MNLDLLSIYKDDTHELSLPPEPDTNNVPDLSESEPEPVLPTVDFTDADFMGDIDYSTRGPYDVVISGPVIGGHGPGQWHRNRREAYGRVAAKYGKERVVLMRQSQGRWSFLIKNLRQEGKNAA